jgi:methylmalonyl-CoA/ethylmalonyl-CoA epimerase
VNELTLHHIGCAVKTIEHGILQYQTVMGFQRVSPVINISSQSVAVCFVEITDNTFVELVAATGEPSPIDSFLRKSQTYYHLCYEVDDVLEKTKELKKNGCTRLALFESEAFSGTKCSFLIMPDSSLVELCQRGRFSAFDNTGV